VYSISYLPKIFCDSREGVHPSLRAPRRLRWENSRIYISNYYKIGINKYYSESEILHSVGRHDSVGESPVTRSDNKAGRLLTVLNRKPTFGDAARTKDTQCRVPRSQLQRIFMAKRAAESSKKFDLTQEARESQATINRSLKGVEFIRLEAANDLLPIWMDDTHDGYPGVVPIVKDSDGNEFPLLDGALTQFDFSDKVVEVKQEGAPSEVITLSDPARVAYSTARRKLKSGEKLSMEKRLQAVIDQYPNGGTIDYIDYITLNRNKRPWVNCVLIYTPKGV